MAKSPATYCALLLSILCGFFFVSCDDPIDFLAAAEFGDPAGSGSEGVLGDGPAGGWIFYDKGSYSDGWRYLEAAPQSTDTEKIWGSFGVLIGGTALGIGTGQANTTAIVNWLNANSETGKAAQFCDALEFGDYSRLVFAISG